MDSVERGLSIRETLRDAPDASLFFSPRDEGAVRRLRRTPFYRAV